MQVLIFALVTAGIVALDQLTKYLTLANIALGETVEFIPNFLSLTYVRNPGAAFSMLEGKQWLFALIFVALTVLLLVEYFKKAMPFSRFERWCIVAVYAGGLGNMIDRVRFGYVVDMIKTEFIRFPIFNVADCFITCGCIALMISLIFFNKEFWKDEKK